MDSYLVVETQTTLEGKITQISRSYDEKDKDNRAEAEAAWHTILSVAAKSSVPYHGAIILDYKGAPVLYDHYEHLPAPEPEPEPEPETEMEVEE